LRNHLSFSLKDEFEPTALSALRFPFLPQILLCWIHIFFLFFHFKVQNFFVWVPLYIYATKDKGSSQSCPNLSHWGFSKLMSLLIYDYQHGTVFFFALDFFTEQKKRNECRRNKFNYLDINAKFRVFLRDFPNTPWLCDSPFILGMNAYTLSILACFFLWELRAL